MTGAGDLDRRITVQRSVLVDNGYEEKPQWADLTTLWASHTAVSDGEKWAAGAVRTQITARFRVRYRPDITTKDRVSYDGRAYDIVAVKEIGRRQFTEITGGLADGE